MTRASMLAGLVLAVAMIAGCSIIKAPPSATTKTGTLSGVVTGPGGPVANADVTITASDATQHAGLSDSGGYYSIQGVPAGPATFSVRASGFAEVDGNVVIAADPGTNRQDISLNPQ